MLNGLLLGLSNNLFCFLTCAAVFLPYALASDQQPYKSVILFMAGRLLAYIFFGFAAGYTSLYFNGRLDPLYFSIFTLAMSLWLIMFALGKLKLNVTLCRTLGAKFQGKNLPFFMGVALGLNLCPPFLIGLSETLQMASVIKPVVFFLGFYIGSSLWLVLFLFTDRFRSNKWVAITGQAASLLAGTWFFIKSVVELAGYIK
jgi:hypothetical protein